MVFYRNLVRIAFSLKHLSHYSLYLVTQNSLINFLFKKIQQKCEHYISRSCFGQVHGIHAIVMTIDQVVKLQVISSIVSVFFLFHWFLSFGTDLSVLFKQICLKTHKQKLLTYFALDRLQWSWKWIKKLLKVNIDRYRLLCRIYENKRHLLR